MDRVDAHSVDVVDVRLRPADAPDRLDVAARRPREDEDAVVARIDDHLVVLDVDVERVGLHQARLPPLEHAAVQVGDAARQQRREPELRVLLAAAEEVVDAEPVLDPDQQREL